MGIASFNDVSCLKCPFSHCSSGSVVLCWNARELTLSLRSSVCNNIILYPSVCRCCCLCFSMAVVIRLQGLRITAGSQDVRKFFTGLKIPDGGVHIIGGEREEAFIIFASDEDARRAMTRSGGVIKGSHVTLLLSSKAEMQSVLEQSTKNVELDQKNQLEENPGRARRSVEAETSRRSGSRLDHNPQSWYQTVTHSNDFFCVYLKGLPFSVTEIEICDFFSGIPVDDIVLLKNEKGANNGRGLVKFARTEDARAALKRDRKYIGSRYVEVYPTTEDDWSRAVGANTGGMFKTGGSPCGNRRNSQYRARSRSPMAPRPSVSSAEEYCILVENLSDAVEKGDIKRLFRNANLEDDQILYLTDDDGKRNGSAFVLFKTLIEYREATACDRRPFFNRWIHTRPISREKMIALLENQNMDVRPTGNPERFQERAPSYPRDPCDAEKMCLFVQNLPFDVRKVEIIDFFLGFSITEDDVVLLRDNTGSGVGKALILFSSEAAAMSALSLSGQRFLGSEVSLKCISHSQMRDLGVEPPIVQGQMLRDVHFSGRSSGASHFPGDTKYSDFRNPNDRNMPMTNVQAHIHGGSGYESFAAEPNPRQDRGNGVRGSHDPSAKHFDGPTCIKLANLPFQIKSEEIYDFCYGYRIIPGSVSLQYDKSGASKGTATVVFESRQEALTAVQELSGRPIGPRKIELMFV